MELRMASSDRPNGSAESGYTLAGLLVVLTVLAVVVAYTVPPLWSTVMHRERDRHTIWVMKQYARSIQEFQRKRGALPVSLEQLQEQNNPRILRRLFPNPQTGEVDWILVPAGTPTPATMLGPGGGNAPGLPPAPATPGAPPAGAPPGPGAQVGPFIGVRPSNSGESFLEFEGAKRYEEWLYTLNELTRDQSGGQAPGQGDHPSPSPQDPRWQNPRPNP
jgi:type II secretory pathway pseudopilin PulG